MNFANYETELNEIAQGYNLQYTAARDRVEAAQADFNSAGTEIKKISAQAELLKQKEALKEVKSVYRDHVTSQVSNLRQRLEKECDTAFAMNPEDLDNATVALLGNAGMLNANDYETMFERFEKAGNTTMCRMVANAASNASKTSSVLEERQKLLEVATKGQQYSKTTYLDAFDTRAQVFNMAMNNPRLFEHWEEIFNQ